MLEKKTPCILLLGTLIYLFLVQTTRFKKIEISICLCSIVWYSYLFILAGTKYDIYKDKNLKLLVFYHSVLLCIYSGTKYKIKKDKCPDLHVFYHSVLLFIYSGTKYKTQKDKYPDFLCSIIQYSYLLIQYQI